MADLSDIGYYASQAGPGITQGLRDATQEQISLSEAAKNRSVQQDYNSILRFKAENENPIRQKALATLEPLLADQPGFEARVNAGNLPDADKKQAITQRRQMIKAYQDLAFNNDPTGLLGLYNNDQVTPDGDPTHTPDIHQKLQESGIDPGTPAPPSSPTVTSSAPGGAATDTTPAAPPVATLTLPTEKPQTMAQVGLKAQIQKAVSPGTLTAARQAASPSPDVNALATAPEQDALVTSATTTPEILAGLAAINADGTVKPDAPAGTTLPGGPQITHDENGVAVISKPQFAPVPVPTYNQLVTMANQLPEVGIAKARWDDLKARDDALRNHGIIPTKEEVDAEDKASQEYIAAVKDGIDHVSKLVAVPSDINKSIGETWSSTAAAYKAQNEGVMAGQKLPGELGLTAAQTAEAKAGTILKNKQAGVVEKDSNTRYVEAKAAADNAATNARNATTAEARAAAEKDYQQKLIIQNGAKLRLDSDKFYGAPGLEESKRFIDKQIDQFVNGSKYTWRQGQGVVGGGSVSLGPGFKIAGGSVRAGYRYSNSGGGVLHPVGTAIGLANKGFPSAIDLLIGYSKAGVGTPGGIDYPLPEPATITDPKGNKTSLTQREILLGASWSQADPNIQQQIGKKAGSPGYPSIGKMRLMMQVGDSWLAGAVARHPGINPADDTGGGAETESPQVGLGYKGAPSGPGNGPPGPQHNAAYNWWYGPHGPGWRPFK